MRSQIRVNSLIIVYIAIFDDAAKILVAHRDRAVHKVPKCIGKLRIHALDHELPGNDAVIFIRHLMQHKVADRVHAENIRQVVRIEDVAPGFAHLAAGLQEPRMTEDLLRKRNIQRHKEDRPVNRMETDDILTDQMQIRRPVLLKEFRVIAVPVIADPGDVVRQRVEPYIDDVPRVKVDRNSPGK